MYSKLKWIVASITLIISSILFSKKADAQELNISFQVFYDQLSPYGQWVDYQNYGYVWIPDAGSDFVPYSSNGHWIFTDYGWTWVSEYNWGWAPFHYGRWYYDNYYGWIWVPDNVWGPSWVSWRQADGYYGWAPMSPGISFNSQYYSQNDHWVFVRDRDIERSDINRHYANREDHDRIIRSSRVINNRYVDNSRHSTYNSGPTREDVQKVTGRSVSRVSVQDNAKPGQDVRDGQLRIYRPQVNRTNAMGQTATPSRVSNLRDIKKPSERSSNTQQRVVTPSNNTQREQQPNKVKAQPTQPRNATPSNAAPVQPRVNKVPQQNNGNREARPSQPQKAAPAENNRNQQQQQSPAQQQNNKPQQVQPRSTSPSPSNKSQRQQSAPEPQRNNKTEQPKR